MRREEDSQQACIIACRKRQFRQKVNLALLRHSYCLVL